MKRRIWSVLFVVCIMAIFAGCGKKEDEYSDYDKVIKLALGGDVKELEKFKEVVLYEDDAVKAVLTNVEKKNDKKYRLFLEYTNKTDREVTFSLNGSTVNGVACEDEGDTVYVEAKGTMELERIMGVGDVVPEKVGEIKYMDFTLSMSYRGGDYESIEYLKGIFIFTKSEGDYFVREEKDSDVLLLDDDSFKVTFVDLDKDKDGLYNFVFYYENKEEMADGFSDITIENAKINGQEIKSYGYWSSIYEKGYEAVSFFDFDLDELGIEEIETLEFDFVYEAELTCDTEDPVVVPMYIELD